MAAKYPGIEYAATEQELRQVAKRIRPSKIDDFASRYLGIHETELEHIKDGAGYDSVKTNFKCLQGWRQNNIGAGVREILHDKLKEAATEGLVDHEAVQILQHDTISTIKGELISIP